jgi:hypothetical protein
MYNRITTTIHSGQQAIPQFLQMEIASKRLSWFLLFLAKKLFVVVVVVEALFIWDGVKRHRELISPPAMIYQAKR